MIGVSLGIREEGGKEVGRRRSVSCRLLACALNDIIGIQSIRWTGGRLEAGRQSDVFLQMCHEDFKYLDRAFVLIPTITSSFWGVFNVVK